jgi:hypothetical protein
MHVIDDISINFIGSVLAVLSPSAVFPAIAWRRLAHAHVRWQEQQQPQQRAAQSGGRLSLLATGEFRLACTTVELRSTSRATEECGAVWCCESRRGRVEQGGAGEARYSDPPRQLVVQTWPQRRLCLQWGPVQHLPSCAVALGC